MKSIGLDKATRRLHEARQYCGAIIELEKGLNVPAFEREWSLFLSAINSVHEILRTSARSDPRSRPWIGEKFRQIKKDPLLHFLLAARGTDYHGLESGTEPHTEGAKYLGFDKNPGISFTFKGNDGRMQVINGGAIAMEGNVGSFKFSFRLAPVTDNHGNVVNPPSSHLGNDIMDMRPSKIARLAIEYYDQLVLDAHSFAKQ